MISHLIHIDHHSDESLQSQIRRNMVDSILVGSFLPNSKLPSSRKLAEQLNVSRNTVVLVYQTLLDEGYIVSKERSGIFVSNEISQVKFTCILYSFLIINHFVNFLRRESRRNQNAKINKVF